MGGYGIATHAADQPGRPALILHGRVRTYGELGERATRLANVFGHAGPGSDDRVAAMLPNGMEFFEVGAASAFARCRFIPVNWHLKSEELAWILTDSGAKVLVADASLAGHVDAARRGAPGCRVLMVGGGGDQGYEAAVGGAGEEPVEPWSTLAYMFYTSGTTGRPKGVVHAGLDPERMHLSTLGLVQMWGFTPDEIHILSGPAYHAGPGGYAFTTLFVGGTVVILPQWDAREWLRLVDEHRVTSSFMTPAHFIRILEVPEEERRRFDLSSLRLVIHGGAPCPIPVKERIIEALAPAEIHELYGASEGGATRISSREWLDHRGSVGRPWPGVEIRILDDDGNPLAAGQQGVIYITPQGGAQFHYHDDPEKTRRAWRDGAFTVGDVGYVDDDGWLFITDRVSDMILLGGVNVYPREIEEVLHRHPAVVDCAVFGVPDPRLGEAIHAVVEARRPVSPEELRDHVRDHLADYKCPQTVELVETLPRDPNGKVMKRFLREAHWHPQPAAREG